MIQITKFLPRDHKILSEKDKEFLLRTLDDIRFNSSREAEIMDDSGNIRDINFIPEEKVKYAVYADKPEDWIVLKNEKLSDLNRT